MKGGVDAAHRFLAWASRPQILLSLPQLPAAPPLAALPITSTNTQRGASPFPARLPVNTTEMQHFHNTHLSSPNQNSNVFEVISQYIKFYTIFTAFFDDIFLEIL